MAKKKKIGTSQNYKASLKRTTDNPFFFFKLMTWFLSVFLLIQPFSCESYSQCHPPPSFYFELIRFFCLLSVSTPVYLITRPGSLMPIDPLWENQETLYTKSFKSSQIKTELIYISGEIWNWSLLSWGPSTSCRKVNLGHFPIPIAWWATVPVNESK